MLVGRGQQGTLDVSVEMCPGQGSGRVQNQAGRRRENQHTQFCLGMPPMKPNGVANTLMPEPKDIKTSGRREAGNDRMTHRTWRIRPRQGNRSWQTVPFA